MGTDDRLGTLSLSEVLELTRLLEAHRPRLLAMLRARIDPALAPRMNADDVLQEAFLTARRRWAERPSPERMSPYAWLVWLARQALFDAWRREHPDREGPWSAHSSMQLSRRLRSPRPRGDTGGGFDIFAKGTTPSAALARKEMQALVHEALDALEPIDREIIWLIHFDGLKPKEAAEVLGIRRGAAYTRYHRALTRFRELLPDSLRQEETNHDANLDQSA